jgi:hypothetical protein
MLSPARVITLVALAVVTALTVFAAFDRGDMGLPSATLRLASPDSNSIFRVTAAPPGDPLRVGDVVAIDDPARLAALELSALRAGSTFPVRRISPEGNANVDEPVRRGGSFPFRFIFLALQMPFVIVAAIVTARGGRNGRDGSLSLAWLLGFIPMLTNPTSASWPLPCVLIYAIVSNILPVSAFACASDFASQIGGDGDARWARRFRRIAFATAWISGITALGVGVDGFVQPHTPVIVQDAVIAALVVQALLVVVGLGLAYRRVRESDRHKALWVITSIVVAAIGFMLTVILGTAGVREPLRDLPLLLLIAMPVGCAYAILRYRLLDIGFVVNRATVFGITSLLVLAALALVDFGLQNLLGSVLVRTGVAIQLGLALAIGVATRPLHDRVDVFVDDLFFRKRHATEAALREFARDVAFIGDRAIVVRRAVETIANHAELSATCFLEVRGGFTYACSSGPAPVALGVDRNDPAVVRMLATRSVVDLHAIATPIVGDFVFPMFTRDRLAGFIACGDKVDGVAAYAPDEIEAIAAVARATALALDLLRVEALERELETLRRSAVGASRAAFEA